MTLLAPSFLLLLSSAWAGDLVVQSTGGPVVVMKGTEVLGTTPLTVKDLPTGKMELGFREHTLSATVFTQKVFIPQTGATVLEVNLTERTALPVVPAAAPPPAPVAVAPAAPAPAAPPPPPPAPSGDLYVVSTPAGAMIWLDGADADHLTPFMLRGVAPGKHHVQVRGDCTRAEADVTVTVGGIARAELTPVAGKGTLSVASATPGARVLVDGAEMGKAPQTVKDLGCGDHTVTLRAPGYLEANRTVRVPAFENVPVDLQLQKEEFGTLVLDVTPLEVNVAVDGIGVGAGPRTLDHIAAGPHKVAGTLEGYTPATVDVTVPANGMQRLDLTLKPPVEAPSAFAAVAARNAAETKKPAPAPKPTPAAKPLPAAPVAPAAAAKPPSGKPSNAPRLVLDVGVTALGVAGLTAGALSFVEQSDAFERYQTVEDNAEAERIYTEEVQPAALRTYVFGGVGLAALAGATGLWITTEF